MPVAGCRWCTWTPTGSASLDEVDDLDLDVSVADSVTVVEWGAGLVEQLTDARLEIRLSRQADTEVRQLELVPVGGDWAGRGSPSLPQTWSSCAGLFRHNAPLFAISGSTWRPSAAHGH